MESGSKLVIFTDGGARGNPGPAGVGVVIFNDQREIIAQFKKAIGIRTNNQAEYEALILAFEEAKKLGGEQLDCNLDSELVVRQLQGKYKIKNSDLLPLASKVLRLSNHFKSIHYRHIPREQNRLADQLVNEILDESK